MHSCTLKYTEPMVRAAARAYAYTLMDWKFWGVLVAAVGLIIFDVAMDDTSIWTGFALGFAFVVVIAVSFAFVSLQRRATHLFRRLGAGVVTLELTNLGLQFTAPQGVNTVSYADVAALRYYRDFALVVYDGGGYSTLPMISVGAKVLDEIESKVRAAGGKVA